MSNQPRVPEAARSPRALHGAPRSTSRKPTIAAQKGKTTEKPVEGLSRGALAGRIAAGAAIGSAAIAGALLFAGRIDGKTPKPMWDKVKQPRPRNRSSAKKPR